MINRYTPIRKKRRKPRRGEPTPAEKEALRRQVFEESGGRCELNLLPTCLKGVLPWDGDLLERWHLVHIRARRRFGWSRDNLCGGCFKCHSASHNSGGKPCPPKANS